MHDLGLRALVVAIEPHRCSVKEPVGDHVREVWWRMVKTDEDEPPGAGTLSLPGSALAPSRAAARGRETHRRVVQCSNRARPVRHRLGLSSTRACEVEPLPCGPETRRRRLSELSWSTWACSGSGEEEEEGEEEDDA